MKEENGFLSDEQARHLTIHGASRNEDGTWSWKFDNYVRAFSPVDFSPEDLRELWGNIACPILLVNGKESWASDPRRDGQLECFKDARSIAFDDAGHWVHHDQLEGFLAEVRAFL
jgi:pimeloyl-ACP methyl ester carboxylesterase